MWFGTDQRGALTKQPPFEVVFVIKTSAPIQGMLSPYGDDVRVPVGGIPVDLIRKESVLNPAFFFV